MTDPKKVKNTTNRKLNKKSVKNTGKADHMHSMDQGMLKARVRACTHLYTAALFRSVGIFESNTVRQHENITNGQKIGGFVHPDWPRKAMTACRRVR